MIAIKYYSLLISLIITSFCFSQNNDVYFIPENINSEYLMLYNNNVEKEKINYSKIKIFSIVQKIDYEKWLIKNKEAVNIGFPLKLISLDFKVKTKNISIISKCELKNLRIIDVDWLEKNAWTENKKNTNFKNIYFLIRKDNENFYSYNVGLSVIEY